MPELLRQSDLVRLTGRERPAAQRKWLDENEIPYRMNKIGKVVLTWTIFNQTILTDGKNTRPNLQAVRRSTTL